MLRVRWISGSLLAVIGVGLAAACALCACDEDDGWKLRDYRPRCIAFAVPDAEVSESGSDWLVVVSSQQLDTAVFLDVELSECSTGGYYLRVDGIDVQSLPSSERPAGERTPIDYVLSPQVDLPVFLNGADVRESGTSLSGLTIRIPTLALKGVPSRKAILELRTNAAEAESAFGEGKALCNQDLVSDGTSGWCGVSEAPTPEDGRFVTRIEFHLSDGGR